MAYYMICVALHQRNYKKKINDKIGVINSILILDVNECLRTPCSNKAVCINDMGSYRCVCPDGLTGQNCDYGMFFQRVHVGERSHLALIFCFDFRRDFKS